MKQLTFRSVSALKFASVTAAIVLSALFVGKAHAQTLDFYLAETSLSDQTASILDYHYDNGAITLVGTYNTGVFGGIVPVAGALNLSGNGQLLSYAGFNGNNGKFDTQVTFNLATHAMDISTVNSSAAVIRASYTLDGTSGFDVVGSTNTPGFQAHGATSYSSITSNAITSVDDITYNNGNIYVTRASNTASGVYVASAPAGIITSATTFTELTGTGLSSGSGNSANYNGIGFLGNNTMFVADMLNDSLNAYQDADFATNPTGSWNLTQSLSFLGSAPAPIQQLSVSQIDATDALIFFTTSSGTATSSGTLSTFNVVTFSTLTGTFSNVTNLGSSSTDFFSGVASLSAVPEPSTYALLGLGLGLVAWMSIRRKAGQRQP